MNIHSPALKRAVQAVQEIDWEAVYWEQMPRVFNFFRYRVNDDALAEDLTAITFMKAWRFREHYSNDLSAFATWLFSIARNVAVDHFRRRREETSLEQLHDLADETDLEATVEHSGDVRHLAELLAGVSERERELVALKYGAELNNREIAGLTGLSESNVGTILHRVVQKLRSRWET